MEYSFNLYEKKKEKKEESTFKKILFSNIVKLLMVIIIFLSSLIYVNINDKNKEKFKDVVYSNSLSFAKIYSLYNKYLGDVIPFKNTGDNDTKMVSNEKIIYDKVEKEGDGYIFSFKSETIIPSIKSGIVVEKKNDKKYGSIITIQDKNGLLISYGNFNKLEVDLYDYVNKGEILGNCNEKLYLEFKKDGKNLSYEKYL